MDLNTFNIVFELDLVIGDLIIFYHLKQRKET